MRPLPRSRSPASLYWRTARLSLVSRNSEAHLESAPDLEYRLSPVLDESIALFLHQLLNDRLDLRIGNFVTRDTREAVEYTEDLQTYVVIIEPGRQLRFEDLVTMHLDHAIPDTLIIALLDPREQFDGDPFLLALHERCHDLDNAALIQALGLDAVDVFLVILAGLLLAGLFRHGQIPVFTVL